MMTPRTKKSEKNASSTQAFSISFLLVMMLCESDQGRDDAACMEVEECDEAVVVEAEDKKSRKGRKRKRFNSNDLSNEDLIPPKKLKVQVVDLNSPQTLEDIEILRHLVVDGGLPPAEKVLVQEFLDQAHLKTAAKISSRRPDSSDSSENSCSLLQGKRDVDFPSVAVVILPNNPKSRSATEVPVSVVRPHTYDLLDCAICHSVVSLTDPGSNCVLPCRHAYHQSCIKPWFQRRMDTNCPIECPRCRHAIPYGGVTTTPANPSTAATSLPGTPSATESFLSDNDLLPVAAAQKTEQQIIDDFTVRLRRRNWDNVTRVVVGVAVGLFCCGVGFGGALGSIFGTLLGLSLNYKLPQRIVARYAGELLASIIFIRSKYAEEREETWHTTAVRYLSVLSAAVGHFFLLQKVFKTNLDNELAAAINVVMVTVVTLRWVQGRGVKLALSSALQGLLAYLMIIRIPLPSLWMDFFFGLSQQFVFTAVM